MSAGKATINLAKGLECDFDLCRGHSGPGITHLKSDAATLGAPNRKNDRATGIGELDGVRKQVETNLLQASRVGDHQRYPALNLRRQVNATNIRLTSYQCNTRIYNATQLDTLFFAEHKF